MRNPIRRIDDEEFGGSCKGGRIVAISAERRTEGAEKTALF